MDKYRFGEIYSRWFKPAVAFVRSYTHDVMAAEDIASESLLSLWQLLQTEQVDSVKAMLLTILKNNALNYLKHLEIRRNATDVIAAREAWELDFRIKTLEACDPKEIFSSEIRRIVARTLEGLSPQTRIIFEMSRYDAVPVKEIAIALNISPKTVEYHITKSIKVLRVALKDYLQIILLFV